MLVIVMSTWPLFSLSINKIHSIFNVLRNILFFSLISSIFCDFVAHFSLFFSFNSPER